MHNRSMGPDAPKLFEQIRARPEQANLEILVARSSARRGTRRQKQRPLRAERKAQVALRWMAVELPVPKDSSLRGQRPVHLNAVHVREQGTPQDGEPIEWMLLTRLPVASARDATRIVEQYRLRWRIEDWHRILKSDCKVEFLGHRTGERIERAVTINAVIAWRLAAMTLKGRETPELPPNNLFSELEISVLEDFALDRKLPPPDNLGLAVLTVAILGGYLNRKKDPWPGHQKFWQGYASLSVAVQTYETIVRLDRTSNLY